MALADAGVTDVFRRTVRKVLGLRVSSAKILRLLEKVSLDEEIKEQWVRRIRDEGMSEEVAEALLEVLGKGQEAGAAVLQLEQALMNWLDEREG